MSLQRRRDGLRTPILTVASWLAACTFVLAACSPTSSRHDAENPHPSTWQPWVWNGYERFPSLYFAANPDGAYTPEQRDEIARFELAIIEYRAGQYVEETTTGLWAGGDLGGFMDAQVDAIARHGGPPTLVYRNAEWAGSMFAPQRALLERQDLFLPDERDCWGFIDYPLDVGETGATTGLAYCRWDVRNPDTRSAFLEVVERAARGPAVGVFFDNGHGVSCDEANVLSHLDRDERRRFMDHQHDLYADAFALLVAHGKYPILSTTIGFADQGPLVPWGNDCPRSQEALVTALDGIPYARNNEFWMWNLGDLAERQIRNTLEEAERGIPTIVHMPYFPEDDGCLEGCYGSAGQRIRFTEREFLEFGIAAFLVSAGPGSYFGFSDMQTEPEGGGWFDESWTYYDVYDEVVTGRPTSATLVGDDGMTFTRRFERGTVWVDVANGTYALDLGDVP